MSTGHHDPEDIGGSSTVDPQLSPGGWPDDLDEIDGSSCPLSHHRLDDDGRWLWFQKLWLDVCALRERYGIALRSGWWRDSLQVEALAALAAWVERYDSGEWDDPPGKLALLYDLERLGALLRDGTEPFNRERDEPLFVEYVVNTWPRPAARRGEGLR